MGKVMHMERKVTKFGNSLGITMTEALKQIGLELGDTVHIDVKESDGEIIIRKANKVEMPAGIGPDFLETLSQVMERYDVTLKALRTVKMELRYLSVQEVIAINVAVIQKYSPGEHIGVKDSGLLESAILRPRSWAFGEDVYPTLFEKAAALFLNR